MARYRAQKFRSGRWFKRLPEMIVCGEGDLVKTSLIEGQIPTGTEIK
jgi:hypothetical protein